MKKLVFVAYLLTGALVYASDQAYLANGKLLSYAEWRELGNYRHMAEDVIVLRDGSKIKATIIHVPAAQYSFGKVPFDVSELAAISLAFKGEGGKIQYITADGQNYIAGVPREDFVVDIDGSKERIPVKDTQLVVLKQRQLRSPKNKSHLYSLELANGDQLPVVLDNQEICLSDGWKEFQLNPKNIMDLAFNGCAQGLIRCYDASGDERTEQLDMAFIQDKYLSVGVPKNAASIKLPWDSIARIQANTGGFSHNVREEPRYTQQQQSPKKSKLARASARVQQDHWLTANDYDEDEDDDYGHKPRRPHHNKRRAQTAYRNLEELDLDYASAWEDSDSYYYRPSTPIPKPKLKTQQPSRLETLLSDDEDYLAVEDFDYNADTDPADDEYHESYNFRMTSKTPSNARKTKIASSPERVTPKHFNEIAELEKSSAVQPPAKPTKVPPAPPASHRTARQAHLDDFGVAFAELPHSELMNGANDDEDEEEEDYTPPTYRSQPTPKKDSSYYLKNEKPTQSEPSKPVAMEYAPKPTSKPQHLSNATANQMQQTIHIFPELTPLSNAAAANMQPGDLVQTALLPSMNTPTLLLKLNGFAIEPKHVTNREYSHFVQAMKHTHPQHWANGKIPQGEENQPVVNISFKDAQAYAAWIGKRLPTHSEWVRASANSRQFRQSGEQLGEWTTTPFVAQLDAAEESWEKNHPNHTQGPVFRVVHNQSSIYPHNEDESSSHIGFRVVTDR